MRAMKFEDAAIFCFLFAYSRIKLNQSCSYRT